MTFTIWFIVIGVLLVLLALAGSMLERLPLSTAMLYLGVGVVLGPAAIGLVRMDPVDQSALLERLAEIVVIISLFSAGLKLRIPFSHDRWRLPVRLAFVSMTVTVGLVALVGWFLLGLAPGAAVLLGAVLAPTDPVLASDVQVEEPTDQDRLRFSLTGEAGLNDGTAFPFVMLGLGLLGAHELGTYGWRWLTVDVLWAIAAGLGVGALLGMQVGRLIIYLRREHREAVGLDDFLALGLISLSYGIALLIHSYGFLAVFAAGLALRRTEREHTPGEEPPPDVQQAASAEEVEEIATGPETAPAYMAQAVLGFSEQLERLGTVGLVLLLGGLLLPGELPWAALWFVPLLFLVIRPLAVWIGLLGQGLGKTRRVLISWFGIRGVGSIYYLMYAVEHGIPEETARQLTGLTLAVVASSIVVHGVTVTPLMERYSRVVEREGERGGDPS